MKISAFHCQWLRNGDLSNAQNKEVRKSKDFPILHSHFSNYDYGSTNYKNISFICTTQSVNVSAFHLQRFGNGEIWYERSEKNVKN